MSARVVSYLDTNECAIPRSTPQVDRKHTTQHQTTCVCLRVCVFGRSFVRLFVCWFVCVPFVCLFVGLAGGLLWPYISMTSLAEPPVAQAILATPFQTLLATPGSAEIRTHV